MNDSTNEGDSQHDVMISYSHSDSKEVAKRIYEELTAYGLDVWYDGVNVNYPTLPRSGLLAPRLLRVGLPVSASELAPNVGTAVPDSAGDFPLQVVRSVPLLPNGHSATIDDARFLSRLNTAEDVASIVLPRLTVWVVSVTEKHANDLCGRCIPSLLARSLRSALAEEGGLAPSIQLKFRAVFR